MVTRLKPNRCRGALATEAIVALGILVLVLVPIAMTFLQESKALRAYYFKAVAMEIIDGEMEALAAGEWRAMTSGTRNYPVRAASATNLPPGEFLLTLTNMRARLEWVPKIRGVGGAVAREVTLK